MNQNIYRDANKKCLNKLIINTQSIKSENRGYSECCYLHLWPLHHWNTSCLILSYLLCLFLLFPTTLVRFHIPLTKINKMKIGQSKKETCANKKRNKRLGGKNRNHHQIFFPSTIHFSGAFIIEEVKGQHIATVHWDGKSTQRSFLH
jgi:hypothetical protein